MRILVGLFLWGLLQVGIAQSAGAMDYGFFGSRGSGSGTIDYEGVDDIDMDTEFAALGFQMETSPLTPGTLFSYRLEIGLESRTLKEDGGWDVDLGGLTFNNTFAFGGNLNESIRLWVGPQVLAGFYGGESDVKVLGDKVDYALVGFGLGLAVGANFGLGADNGVILTTTAALRAVGFGGGIEWHGQNEDVSAGSGEFVFTVGLLF